MKRQMPFPIAANLIALFIGVVLLLWAIIRAAISLFNPFSSLSFKKRWYYIKKGMQGEK